MKNNQYALSIASATTIEVVGKVAANTVAYSFYVAGSVIVVQGLTASGMNNTDVTLLSIGYAYGMYFGFSMFKSKLIDPMARSISNLISFVTNA